MNARSCSCLPFVSAISKGVPSMARMVTFSRKRKNLSSKLKEFGYIRLMAVRTTVDNIDGTYFITFTCQHCLPLFEITNSYDAVYKWFDHLKTKGHYIKGYCPDSSGPKLLFSCYTVKFLFICFCFCFFFGLAYYSIFMVRR